MSKSKLFGHDIEVKDNVWVFSDTLEPTEGSYTKRKCGFCGKHRDESDHDPCIKDLPYTLNACCGHGNVGDVYVMLQDRGCSGCFFDSSEKWISEAVWCKPWTWWKGKWVGNGT